ncbi:aminopeptidase N, partial [bacterium]|nr:aminopeptidase N [bacterium]
GVIAHEYFHNWTGNRITCRDWFQLSLKEGLTVFRDQQFSADMNSAAVQRIEDVRLLRQFQFREDAGPMAHQVRPDQYLEINNFYTVTIYNKGAEVIRMLHTLLGPATFRRGMDHYFHRHDGQAVTCDDFVAALAEAAGRDLTLFKRWYVQAGTPRLTVTEQWDEPSRTYVVTVAQETPPTPGQPDKQPLHLPIVVGLLGSDGGDLAARVSCPYERRGNDLLLELQEAQQDFVFRDVPEKPVLSFLRGFSAPVLVNRFQSREDAAFIMQHDSDLFNRWDAAFSLAEAVILECLAKLVAAQTMELDPVYLEAMHYLIAHPTDDRSLTALALQLPAENHLLQALKQIDPVALHGARSFVKRELAGRLSDGLLNLYRDNEPSATYRLTGDQVGRRSLRAVCLDYLVLLGEERQDLLDLCVQQYRQGDTMTEKIGALAALAQVPGALRDEIFDHFENQWRSDPLVMDKWFALQAASPAADTYDRVKKLVEHSAFSLKNPNKVRSLFGVFGQNHVHFHHESGRGYRLLADLICKLDPLNPQLAARLMQPFVTWRRYTKDRRQMMEEILREIGGQTGISRDVYEIVSKSLAASPRD